MKRQLLILAFILLILFAVSFTALTLVLNPAFIKSYDLSKTGTANIGSSLSGITTPFLTAISSVLLFFALIKQIESNKDQRLKADGDMIFLLLNQLDAELESYSYKSRSDVGAEQLTTEKFFTTVRGHNVILLIKSFKMIENRIEIAKLSKDYSAVFYYKLYNFYQIKLRDLLHFLIENNDFRNESDLEPVKFILSFYEDSNRNVRKYLGEFDGV